MITINRKDYEAILLQILNARDMREITDLMIKRYRFGIVISDLAKGKQSANYQILKNFSSTKKINEQFIIDQAKTAISIIQPISEEEDYYKILGSNTDSTPEEIRFNWISLMKKFHPDKVGKTGLEKTKKINEAYNVLSDFEKRRSYDERYLPAAGIKVIDPAENQFRNKSFVFAVIFIILVLTLGYIHNSRQINRIGSISNGNPSDEDIKNDNYSISGSDHDKTNELDVEYNDSENLAKSPVESDHENINNDTIEIARVDKSEKSKDNSDLITAVDGLDGKGNEVITDNIIDPDKTNEHSDNISSNGPGEFAELNTDKPEVSSITNSADNTGSPDSDSDVKLSKPDFVAPDEKPEIEKEILVSGKNRQNNITYENETGSADGNNLWKDTDVRNISPYNNVHDGIEKSVDNVSNRFHYEVKKDVEHEKPAQNIDTVPSPDIASLSGQENLPDKSSVYLVISDYITAYKNRDIGKLQGLFSINARENGKSIQDVFESYRDNFKRINILAYDIKFDNVNLKNNRADVYGNFIITYKSNSSNENQRSRGSIYWNLLWDQDSWFIDEINYEVSRTGSGNAIESAF